MRRAGFEAASGELQNLAGMRTTSTLSPSIVRSSSRLKRRKRHHCRTELKSSSARSLDIETNDRSCTTQPNAKRILSKARSKIC